MKSLRRGSTPRTGRFFCKLLALLTWVQLTQLAAAQPAFRSTQPAPRIEYWQQRMNTIDKALQSGAEVEAARLVFLGDSITDFWLLGDSPWHKDVRYGRTIWDESFGVQAGANRALNLAVSGDRLEHVLYRIQPKRAAGLGQLDAVALDPEFVVLLIGINNSWMPEQPVVESIVEGTRAVLDAVRARLPAAHIVLQTLLPVGEHERNQQVVRPVNKRLAALIAEPNYARHASLLDLHAGFVDHEGQPIPALFVDGLHPNEAGYSVWRTRLLQHLTQERRRVGR